MARIWRITLITFNISMQHGIMQDAICFKNQLLSAIVKMILLVFLHSQSSYAQKFTPYHHCADTNKICTERGQKIIDGFKVIRDCWEWSYTKTCHFPSKNDCSNYSHCYFSRDLPCILTDRYSNCVNLHKEFSCKAWEHEMIPNKTARYGLKASDGQQNIVCGDIKCIDGNCVDKSYQTDADMMDSISKLYATSLMKADKDGNFNLFAGSAEHCSKKATEYTNCCNISANGWGKNLGARCSKSEEELMESRKNKLCIYIGKTSHRTIGITTVTKHHFCCFGTLLDKVVQMEGRKQLHMNFGSGSNPNCRGFTLDEIQKLDFTAMDFTEFIEDFKVKFAGKYKPPNAQEIGSKVKNSKENNIRLHDQDPYNKSNNISGWSKDISSDSLDENEEM